MCDTKYACVISIIIILDNASYCLLSFFLIGNKSIIFITIVVVVILSMMHQHGIQRLMTFTHLPIWLLLHLPFVPKFQISVIYHLVIPKSGGGSGRTRVGREKGLIAILLNTD